ncbi:MAG: class I SAM-dependent methyltransferase [Pseudomonadota bacterium]
MPSFKVLKRYAIAFFQDYRQFNRRQLPRECPICGYKGLFTSVNRPPRWNARCPSCDSRERHRLAWFYYGENGIEPGRGLQVLHFAPEPYLYERMKDDPGYIAVDPKMPGVEHREDMRNLTFADGTFDFTIAHHVLEHIDDDAKAMGELYRVLKPGGTAILSVPQNLSREETFEDASFAADNERTAAFTARDHLRLYGQDFGDRLEHIGFNVSTYRKSPADEVKYGLVNTEVIYIAQKPDA